jgi:cell division protein FtsA
LIGVLDGRALEIIGRGDCPCDGLRKGSVRDPHVLHHAIDAALGEAEAMAQQSVESVYISYSGADLEGMATSGAATASGRGSTVTQADCDRACAEARQRTLPEGRRYLSYVRQGFEVDGAPTRDPVGQEGEQVSVRYWNIHADETELGSRLTLLNHLSVTVADVIPSSLASACMVTQPSERQAGCVVVDIGAGTTDWLLYRNGKVAATGVIPVGGQHVINDLALALRVEPTVAATLLYCLPDARWREVEAELRLWVHGEPTEGHSAIGNFQTPARSLARVVEARLDELFEVLREEVADHGGWADLEAGVLLTGGVSKLPGLAGIAASRLDTDARLADLPAWVSSELSQPENATLLGLLYYGLSGLGNVEEPRPGRRQRPALLEAVGRMFGG